MPKKSRPQIIAALKKSHAADDCKKIAKKFKVKLSYVYYVRKSCAQEVGYKKRAPRTGAKRVVTLAFAPKTGKAGGVKRHSAKPIGLRGTAVKVLTDHGNQLPAQERAFYRAALDLVLAKGE